MIDDLLILLALLWVFGVGLMAGDLISALVTRFRKPWWYEVRCKWDDDPDA